MPHADYYIHDIDPILIHIYGDFGIRYYGLAYALGFILAIYILNRFRKNGLISLTADQQSSALFALILGVLVGGRLGHVFLYDLSGTIANPLTFFEVWKGGMASHGGFIGVTVACFWICRRYNIKMTHLADLLSVMAPPGLMFGRIANFINGELWGTPTNVSWAVIFPASAPYGTPIAQIQPRHPSQLYEAALEGLVLIVYTQWRIWKTEASKTPGRLAGEFLLIYSIVRIIGEQFREYDSPPILGMSRGIFYSIFLAIIGILFIIHSYRKPVVKN